MRIVRIAIMLITAAFVVMMFLPLVGEIIRRTGVGSPSLP